VEQELAVLRGLCERLAFITGASLPPEFPHTTAGGLQLLDGLVGIAERKHQRAARTACDDAARLERLKSQFLLRVSHELHTPLASIEGFARLLLRDMGQVAAGKPSDTSFDTRREFLNVISQESHRLGELIENLLDLSTLESRAPGAPGAAATLFAAREACLEAVLSFCSRWPDVSPRQVLLEFQPEPDGPLVFASRVAVRDMLAHLLDNARKFAEGREIVLGAGAVIPPSGPVAPRAQTRLYVRDRGQGIPAAELAGVFNGFQRAGSAQVPGAGLGLSIVKNLALRNGGCVTAESDEGHGTTFSIFLPAQPTEQDKPS
jgi:signal transduction histidine kinase